MKEQWLDPNGVIHIIPLRFHDGATWCNIILTEELQALTDLPPTCTTCIANAARFNRLPNIRSLRE